MITLEQFYPFLIAYGVSVVISLLTFWALNWEDIHTVRDFIIPHNYTIYSIIYIYTPGFNTIVALISILYCCSLIIGKILDIKIK